MNVEEVGSLMEVDFNVNTAYYTYNRLYETE